MRSRNYVQYLVDSNSAKFRKLRPAQEHVLAEYARNFPNKRDLAVELPTGAGKTLIALLIASAWLAEGRKVAILSANKTLARQMAAEGRDLRVPVAYMEGRGVDIPIAERRAYQRAQSVGIMNYWVYFNQNPVVDRTDLLVMDDAHLAEHCLHSLYSVEISRHRHPELFGIIASELLSRFPEYAVLADAVSDQSPTGAPAELLSFIDQDAVADRLREILDAQSAASPDVDLRFRWQRLRQSVRTANLYVSRDSLWLRPYIYPLISNPHYGEVEQAIHMSATIGDPSDLARRLGVRPIAKIPVPNEFANSIPGRRLIIANRTNDEKDIPTRMQAALLASIRIHPKSVWLCASEAEASHFQTAVSDWLQANQLTHPFWLLTSLGDEIDQFRAARAGHLFVGGRFDGMDFEGDECRIVVVTTLPRAINLQEEFISSYLRDSGFMRRRLNQRIVQALGRCNRAENDYAVYFLADQRFATHFAREMNRAGIPRNMRAEIDLAQELAERPDAEIAAKVRKFLDGDFASFDAALAPVTAGLPPDQPVPPIPDTSNDEVIGWAALFDSQNYTLAEERFERCWRATKEANLLEICAFHGWHWSKALFLAGALGDAGRRERALQVLEEAIARGGRSSWFNRMRASLSRAYADSAAHAATIQVEYAEVLLRSFDELLERTGTTGDRFQRYLDHIATRLASNRHAEFQEGLEWLGKLLAYAASRPKYGAATDCRWRGVFGNMREVVTFEAKIEHDSATQISATDIGQAHNQRARADAEFGGAGYTLRSAIVTPLTEIYPDAISSIGQIKILPKDAAILLFERVRVLLSEYRARWSLDDVIIRNSAAEAVRPRIPRSGWLTRAVESGTPFVNRAAFVNEWR